VDSYQINLNKMENINVKLLINAGLTVLVVAANAIVIQSWWLVFYKPKAWIHSTPLSTYFMWALPFIVAAISTIYIVYLWNYYRKTIKN